MCNVSNKTSILLFYRKIFVILTPILLSLIINHCRTDETTSFNNPLILPNLSDAKLAFGYFHLDTTSNGIIRQTNDGRYILIDTLKVLISHNLGYKSVKKSYFTIYRPNSSSIISGELKYQITSDCFKLYS